MWVRQLSSTSCVALSTSSMEVSPRTTLAMPSSRMFLKSSGNDAFRSPIEPFSAMAARKVELSLINSKKPSLPK